MQENILQLILHASFFVKLILLLLLGFSILSWAVIVYKYDYLNAAARESAFFLNAFESTRNPRELMEQVEHLKVSPLVRLFKAVYSSKSGASQESLVRMLRRYGTLESEKLHTYLTFLATTGSTAPFIGLLGTVWGIINAFRGIGATGSASLAVVAPGIAEALITTAAGLAAAIPAVMAYNYYLSWARRMALEMENFSEQLPQLLSQPPP